MVMLWSGHRAIHSLQNAVTEAQTRSLLSVNAPVAVAFISRDSGVHIYSVFHPAVHSHGELSFATMFTTITIAHQLREYATV